MAERMGSLASTAWLADHLGAVDLRIIDATWFMPVAGRSALNEYRAGHIPGAIFYDIDQHAERSSPLPHMLPSADVFAETAGALGIAPHHRIVVYDAHGLFSAARVWWAFRTMGAQHVAVLDGGLPKWRAENRALTTAVTDHAATRFAPNLDGSAVAALADIRKAAMHGGAQIIDARSAARFRGEAPEPRPGLPSGHIPGSINVPFDTLLQEDGALKSTDMLAAVFRQAGVDLARPIITSCGSGVTAAILSLALGRLGVTPAGLYDGSWSEWAGRDDTDVAVAKSS
ncbi:MAG: 3-mercaptopyruvate sulfurtransferase [Alphaproteobacteria bacterium]